jgi:DNA-binding transcriptional regulator PaaX
MSRIEETLLHVLRSHQLQAMTADELISSVVEQGFDEWDVRDALLSMLAADYVELTHERKVRLEDSIAA